MISSVISRVSAAVLASGGLALLFAPDAVLPRVAAGVPSSAALIGQLIAAGWLALAMLNWMSRSLMLGGIYGRPVVITNAMLYFVSAMALLRLAQRGIASPALVVVLAVFATLAALYWWLLLRGPFERDFTARTPA